MSSRKIGRVVCPKCGREGVAIVKRIRNREYVYVKHGQDWCYIGPADTVIRKLLQAESPKRKRGIIGKVVLFVIIAILVVTFLAFYIKYYVPILQNTELADNSHNTKSVFNIDLRCHCNYSKRSRVLYCYCKSRTYNTTLHFVFKIHRVYSFEQENFTT